MQLSSAIKQSARSSAESTTLLSVERIASITSGLQFYIPTAVLPYFDEGIFLKAFLLNIFFNACEKGRNGCLLDFYLLGLLSIRNRRRVENVRLDSFSKNNKHLAGMIFLCIF